MKKRPTIDFTSQPRLPFDEFEEDAVPDRPEHVPATRFPRPRELRGQRQSEIALNAAEHEAGAIPRKTLQYISFGSGSSGNSCYIGNDSGGVVIDAGIRTDIIEETMHRAGLPMSHIKALLLTHDHSDHVRYSYNLLRTHRHLSLLCTPRVLNGLLRRHSISRRIREYHTPIFKEIPFKVAGMEITAFDVPHDGSDNMGFFIQSDNLKFTIATDLGAVTERARHYIRQANYLVIEANYDDEMLTRGRYPEYLKARIRSANGHLDNRDTAALLSEIISPDLKYIFLCHLSKDNNTPAKALEEVRRSLRDKGLTIGHGMQTVTDLRADVQLLALPRFEPTRRFILF